MVNGEFSDLRCLMNTLRRDISSFVSQDWPMLLTLYGDTKHTMGLYKVDLRFIFFGENFIFPLVYLFVTPVL